MYSSLEQIHYFYMKKNVLTEKKTRTTVTDKLCNKSVEKEKKQVIYWPTLAIE